MRGDEEHNRIFTAPATRPGELSIPPPDYLFDPKEIASDVSQEALPPKKVRAAQTATPFTCSLFPALTAALL